MNGIMPSNGSNSAEADNDLSYADESELNGDLEYDPLNLRPTRRGRSTRWSGDKKDTKTKGYSLAAGNMHNNNGDVSLSPLYARNSGEVHGDERRSSQTKVSGGRRIKFPTSLRRGKQSDSSASSKPSARGGSFQALTDSSIDKENALANYEGNPSMFAAAQVVAASGHQGYKNFKKGENVLVTLHLLNLRFEQNGGLLVETTISPVNKYGFPAGKGKTREGNKQGPFVYVIAQVESVHFDEAAPYFFVKRADNNEIQRVDQGEMEPIEKNSDGEQAAMIAAKHFRGPSGKSKRAVDPNRFGRFVARISSFVTSAIVSLKEQATIFLSGDGPYRFEIKITTVNFLVLCSFIVAFLDQAKLAFFKETWDFILRWVILISWIILALELIFEKFIRPNDYQTLITNEKAYLPSTARYISSFHLFFESLALLLMIPDFMRCFGKDPFVFNLVRSSIFATIGPTTGKFILGHAYFVGVRLRLFGLVRHRRNHWINAMFIETKNEKDIFGLESSQKSSTGSTAAKESKDGDDLPNKRAKGNDKAATIGTALMVVNSHRAMLLLLLISAVVPFLASAATGGPNTSIYKMAEYLQHMSMQVPEGASPDSLNCKIYNSTIHGWMSSENYSMTHFSLQKFGPRIVLAEFSPTQCGWAENSIISNKCNTTSLFCEKSDVVENSETLGAIEYELGLREGVLINVTYPSLCVDVPCYQVSMIYDLSESVALANFDSFLLQLTMLITILISLGVLRSDANKLVILPLRRMLSIVLRYAQNPLAPAPIRPTDEKNYGGNEKGKGEFDADFDTEGSDKLGSYETGQLITAVTKITDLLRKCWGVAGAGIISANLERKDDGDTVSFNPTVPGQMVYALFAFAGINDFSSLLRALDREVMKLINDIAKVVHNEVYRWGFGDRGQCNKNLGPSFLMVYRIGDFKTVQEKKARAEDVIFTPATEPSHSNSSENAKNNMKSIRLASLPGIAAFTDRALLGMLKSFAGINRDRDVKNWEKDFKLGLGVGAISVEMIFGMDAGWAVEGAVGSAYKIDATYLSPHVNMASRMMCACKQFKLTILLSQAVEELMSTSAREKLRHVDTVFVKGSSEKKRIYTYDARHKGVNFFLYHRSDEQADKDSANYTPAIWNSDQDLQAMRNHVTEEFEETFKKALTQYLHGHWRDAASLFEEANNIMIETVVDDGRIEHVNRFKEDLLNPDIQTDEAQHLRRELGDGPCQSLLSYIKKRNYTAPDDWHGVRQLTSK